jgi:hypothetical protein
VSRYLVSRAVLTSVRGQVPPHTASWVADDGEVSINVVGPGFDLYASAYPAGTKLIVTVRADPPAQEGLAEGQAGEEQ